MISTLTWIEAAGCICAGTGIGLALVCAFLLVCCLYVGKIDIGPRH